MNSLPATLGELQLALSLESPSGPEIARWRDMYLDSVSHPEPMVELCVDELHARRLCYSCGRAADRLVHGEFPWACGPCADSA